MNFKKFSHTVLVGLVCLDLLLIIFLLGCGFSNDYLTMIKTQAVFLAIIMIISFLNASSIEEDHGYHDANGLPRNSSCKSK